MKRLLAALLFSGSLALAVTPDCTQKYIITNDGSINPATSQNVYTVGVTPPIPNLTGTICQAWTVIYSMSGFTQISMQVETSSARNGVYVAWPGTVNYGQVPWTPTASNSQGYLNLTGTYNFLRVSTPFAQGTGTVYVQLFGWVNPANVGSIINYPIPGGSGSGTVDAGNNGQFAVYSGTGTTVGGHTIVAGDIPPLSYDALGAATAVQVLSLQKSANLSDIASSAAARTNLGIIFSGIGGKTITGTPGITNDCVKWLSTGDIGDSGSACGSGSSPLTTKGDLFGFSTVGARIPVGTDTFVLTADSTQTLGVKWAVAPGGSLPSQTGNAGLWLTTNGTSASWSDQIAGPSGALCAGTGCSGGTAGQIDIVTSVVPRLAAANTFTGIDVFNQLQVAKFTVSTLPTCNSSFETQVEGVTDGAASPVYLAIATGGGSVHLQVYCNGTNWINH